MREDKLAELMNIKSISGMRLEDAFAVTGQLVDLADDFRDAEGIRHAVQLLNELLAQDLSDVNRGIANYYLGNAWSALRHMGRAERPESWDWQQEELENEIIALRFATRAAKLPGFPADGACRVFTNVGNALNYVGRPIEAIEYWDNALEVVPGFPMAKGNKGVGLFYYAAALYDDGHRAVFARIARDLLEDATKAELHEQARKEFESVLTRLNAILGSNASAVRMNGYELGDTEKEEAYRRWCLRHCLFLNPLNDLGPYPIAARDVLGPPAIVVKVNEGPYYPGFFNQMKQEFVSSRYLFYSGLQATEPHFSDREVLLTNTMDYPTYCLAIEKQKLAFRSAYSILDKVAFFLNQYMGLGIPERRVSFRGLWYEKQEQKRGLRSEFTSRRNWPLRGLFWLSKDLYEDEEGFRAAIEPDAKDLAEVRHHLEHKYLKVHEEEWRSPSDHTLMGLSDSLAHSLRRREFIRHLMKMLRLARSSLIYLSLGVQAEELRRASERDPDMLIGPAVLDIWDDEWKK